MEIKYTNRNFLINFKDKKYKLVYKTKKYIELDVTDKNQVELNDYIVSLKEQGKTIKFIKNEQKWYELLEERIIPHETRLKIINSILKEPILWCTLEENLNHKWEEINFHKEKDNELNDSESVLLDTMSSYLLAGYDLDDILSEDKENFIHQKEIFNFEMNEEVEGIKKKKKNVDQKQTCVCESKQKKWRLTSTYKFNKIFNKNNPVIDLDTPYFSEWAYVNANNQFKYNNKTYNISDKLSQYQPKEDRLAMDSIYILEQNEKLHFYDVKVNKINNKYIRVI